MGYNGPPPSPGMKDTGCRSIIWESRQRTSSRGGSVIGRPKTMQLTLKHLESKRFGHRKNDLIGNFDHEKKLRFKPKSGAVPLVDSGAAGAEWWRPFNSVYTLGDCWITRIVSMDDVVRAHDVDSRYGFGE